MRVLKKKRGRGGEVYRMVCADTAEKRAIARATVRSSGLCTAGSGGRQRGGKGNLRLLRRREAFEPARSGSRLAARRKESPWRAR